MGKPTSPELSSSAPTHLAAPNTEQSDLTAQSENADPGRLGLWPRLWMVVASSRYYTTISSAALAFAAMSLYLAYSTDRLGDKGGHGLSSLGLSILFFWIFGPPVYFFLEHQVLDAEHRAAYKDTRDLGSKIWAAVLAALLFRLSKL